MWGTFVFITMNRSINTSQLVVNDDSKSDDDRKLTVTKSSFAEREINDTIFKQTTEK